MSDCEGHGHKAVVYKSHFPPLRHFSCTETPADTLANKPHLTKRHSSLFFMPHNNPHPHAPRSDNPKLRFQCFQIFQTISKISKSDRIPLAGSYGLLLLNCGLLLFLIRDYNYKEKESNFNFPIDVVARGKQIMMDI